MPYSEEERKVLLKMAHDAIAFRLENHAEMPVDVNQYSDTLQQYRACFVTLHLNGQLRGCIGSLQAYQPLILDVARNAYAAAFSDPRFSPLTGEEFRKIKIDISVLSEPVPMTFKSEQDLINQLRVGIDGLILSDIGHKGTFLPSVWDELPNPELFLKHLKMKAGFSQDYWSKTVRVDRYTAEKVG